MTESVYDLLPKELQLQPSSAQTDPPTMSQMSGGEAGPPPSAALASGELPCLVHENHDLGSVSLRQKQIPQLSRGWRSKKKKKGLVSVSGGNFTLSPASETCRTCEMVWADVGMMRHVRLLSPGILLSSVPCGGRKFRMFPAGFELISFFLFC